MDHNVNRNPGLGAWVLINASWYYVNVYRAIFEDASFGDLSIWEVGLVGITVWYAWKLFAKADDGLAESLRQWWARRGN